MVFDGTPSKGCLICIKRRVKCDGQRPKCLRCMKGARDCPGYRDPLDLVFRDQTAQVNELAKANWKAAKDKGRMIPPQQSYDAGRASTSTSARTSARRNTGLSPSLIQPVQDRAQCFFISHYVLPASSEKKRSFNDFYTSIMRGSPDPAFKLAMEACSLASLSKGTGSSHRLRLDALQAYGKALVSMSSAMGDPLRFKRDDILASTLLFALFENLMPSDQSISKWSKHVTAAIDLVHYRGSEQCQTYIGREIFVNVKLLAGRLAALEGKDLPRGLDFWTRLPGEANDDDFSHTKFLQCAHIRYKVEATLRNTPQTPDKNYKVLALMHECQQLEDEMIDWYISNSKSYRYWAVSWIEYELAGNIDEAEAYPGPVFAFEDLYTSTILIAVWAIRLIMHAQIVRCAAWLCHPFDYQTTPEYENAYRVGGILATNIVASIPYQLGWFSTRIELLESTQLPSYACGEDNHSKALGAEHVSMMLSILAICDFATRGQRAWAKGRLRHIYQTHGLSHAKRESELPITIPSFPIQVDSLCHNSGQPLRPKGEDEALLFGLLPPSASKLQKHLASFTNITQDFTVPSQ